MNLDIAVLVRESLLESGCEESLLGDFDGHSTIALDFSDRPSLLINVEDGDVWIWSQFSETTELVMSQKSNALLAKLIEGCRFSRTGQLQLSINDGIIELKGLVSNNYLYSGTQFAEVLDEFFMLQEQFIEILQ